MVNSLTVFPVGRLAVRLAVALSLLACGLAGQLAVADSAQIEIVGSSTVYPFTTVVSERFSLIKETTAPKVEATGTGGGMKLLCAGVGLGHPDLANASRAVKESEIKLCASNGVSAPLEVKIGYDGIVMAHSNTEDAISLTQEEVFMALARDIADANGVLRPNPSKLWSDVSPSLPAREIRVYGPPPTSGTRDAFVELAMEEGCQRAPGMSTLKELDEAKYDAVCASIREDGAFIEAGENDNLIIQRLVSNPGTFGIFGFSFLEENLDKVTGVLIDGVEPTFEAIEGGEYPLARPLFIYVKREHADLKQDLRSFVMFYLDDAALGPDGFLLDRGLVPLPEGELAEARSKVAASL